MGRAWVKLLRRTHLPTFSLEAPGWMVCPPKREQPKDRRSDVLGGWGERGLHYGKPVSLLKAQMG